MSQKTIMQAQESLQKTFKNAVTVVTDAATTSAQGSLQD